MSEFSLQRVYDPPAPDDGIRILVDRLWPRGLTKEGAQVDIWCKELAPSTELRRWFHKNAEQWQEFTRRYRKELAAQQEAIQRLQEEVDGKAATLLFSVRDRARTHAMILKDVLEDID